MSDAQFNWLWPADWYSAGQQSLPASQFFSVYTLDTMFYGVEYPFGQFGSAAPAALPPMFFCSFLLPGYEILKNPWLRVALLGKNQNISVLATLFSHRIQNTALYQLLTRKLLVSSNSIPAETRSWPL